ncbi:MAG: nitroreductase family deazaflavin-dependent oxidoreductase [Anaerolineae bacterium]|nr:MAG: nitroreductase family deazaflavin-dependent oxidoreductase [Anaerolineae bacterium]
MRDGARLVVVASDSGAPNNPGWYYNIKANPLVTVEVGTETFQALATITEGERSQLYDRMAASMPGYDEYRHKTSRVIPVIVLTPAKVGSQDDRRRCRALAYLQLTAAVQRTGASHRVGAGLVSGVARRHTPPDHTHTTTLATSP